MKPRDTFRNLALDNPSTLWTVVYKNNTNGKIVIFPILPLRPNIPTEDILFIIKEDEHPNIHKLSYVSFAFGQILEKEHQRFLIRSDFIEGKKSISTDLYEQILTGAVEARRTPKKIKNLLSDIR